jgi:DUF177 domain-containing protein
LWFGLSEARVFISLEELELNRVVVSETYASGALDYHGAAIQQLGPIKVNAAAELEGQEIHIQGHIGGRLGAECDRCLAKVEMPVERDFDLYYRPLETIAREAEVEVPTGELNVGFFSDSGIALEDVVTEQVILSMPMKVVCRVDCQGLCPVCGADRNRIHCGCRTPSSGAESPFSSLLEP